MDLFLVCFISGASFLLGFLLFFHPLQQNVKANKWLGFFVCIMGCAFMGIYLIKMGATQSSSLLFKCLMSSQFLLAPTIYISIQYFVKPAKVFQPMDWLHFVPFFVYFVVENIVNYRQESISTLTFFAINRDVSFLIRDILPIQSLFYSIKCYTILIKHKANLKLISSNINQTNLDWLIQFLLELLRIDNQRVMKFAN